MKKVVLVLGLILMVGFSSAYDSSYKEKYSETRYSPGGSFAVSKTTLTYYDNEDRLSTYNYRHGYSHRATQKYYEDKIIRYNKDPTKKTVVVSRKERGGRSNVKVVENADLSRSFSRTKGYDDKRGCYITPPSNRLFYIAC